MRSLLEERAWLVRVRGPSGIVGAAFAVDAEHILTCAHVVEEVGANGPGGVVAVEFPLLRAGCDAEVLAEAWLPEAGAAGDVALLRLRDPPEGMRPAPLRALGTLDRLSFTVYGFPIGYDDSVPTEGTAGKAAGLQWVKLEGSSALAVEPGFSGGAVWSDQHQRVVGLMTTRDTVSEGRVAFAIPIRELTSASEIIQRALPTPLDLDPALAVHWGPRSRGVNSDRDDAGWLFSGRRLVLRELVEWLGAHGAAPMRVLTGTPGSGKSAVLARLVTTADLHYRARLPELRADDETVPPVGVFDVTFHATRRTVGEFVVHVADVCQLNARTAAELLEAVDRANRSLVMAVDAIDEAAEPKELCWLLSDLAERGARILLGCREPLPAQLLDPSPLQLDKTPYLKGADVELYVRRLLADRVSGLQTETGALARNIAAAAHGNFLVAQLMAHAAALGGAVVRPFPRTVARAFDRLLDALPDPAGTRELLLPLAYAFGDGLPIELWLMAVGALSRTCEPADLGRLLAGSAAAFLITSRNTRGGRRYSLFHEALAETLIADREVSTDHLRLWRTWTAQLPRTNKGGANWGHASPYLLAHAAEHATQADTLGELADNVSYLLSGQLAHLLVQLAKSPRQANSEALALLRLAASRAQALDPHHRAALLALAAYHLGLPAVADKLVAEGRPLVRPRWAHTLGSSHQALANAGDSAVAIGRVRGRDIIAAGSWDGTIRLCDAASGEPIGGPLTGHTGPVNSVAIGRAGERDIIVSASSDGTVRVWDADSSEPIGNPLTGHTGPVNSVAIGRAGEREIIVSASSDGTLRVWDATSSEPIGNPLTGHTGPVNSVAIGRADEREIIASASDDETVRLWDAVSGDPIGHSLTGHTGPVKAVAIGRAGERDILVSASSDGTARVWDATSGERFGESLTDHTGWMDAVAIGRVGERVILASASYEHTVRVWDAVSGEPIGEALIGHAAEVNAVAIGHVGERNVIASTSDDETVRLWDATSSERIGRPLSGHTEWVKDVAFGHARERAIIASASWDGTVRLWDATDGEPIGNPHTDRTNPVEAVAIGRAGERDIIVTGSYDHTVRLWDAVSGEPILHPLTGHTSSVSAVAIGHVGERYIIVSSGGETVRVWDAVSGQPIGQPLTGHTGPVSSVAIGSVGECDIIASGSADRTIRLWDATNGELIGNPLTGHTAAVMAVAIGRAGDRDIIASGSWDGTVRLWDAVSAKPIGPPLTGHTDAVETVAIARAGDLDIIASASRDRSVRLWDATSGVPLDVIHALEKVTGLAFADDGYLYFATGIAVCSVSVSQQSTKSSR